MSKLASKPLNHARAAWCASLAAALCGCAANNAPKAPLTEDIIVQYENEFTQQSTQPVGSVKKRNELISKELTVINMRYAEFIGDTIAAKKNKDLVTDMGTMTMNLVSTAIGATGVKTVLSAMSAGLRGGSEATDRNLYEKSFSSLVSQMNADRKKILVYIVGGMGKGLDEYPWSQAVDDLMSYYNAGTLQGVMNSIQKDAGNKEMDADRKIEELRAQAGLAH